MKSHKKPQLHIRIREYILGLLDENNLTRDYAVRPDGTLSNKEIRTLENIVAEYNIELSLNTAKLTLRGDGKSKQMMLEFDVLHGSPFPSIVIA